MKNLLLLFISCFLLLQGSDVFTQIWKDNVRGNIKPKEGSMPINLNNKTTQYNDSFIEYSSFCDLSDTPVTFKSYQVDQTEINEIELKNGISKRSKLLCKTPVINYINEYNGSSDKEYFELFGVKIRVGNKSNFYSLSGKKEFRKISVPDAFKNELNTTSEFSEFSIFELNNSKYICITKAFYSPYSVKTVYLFDITDTTKIKFCRYQLFVDEPWVCGIADFNHDGYTEILINDYFHGIQCYSLRPQGIVLLKDYYINLECSNYLETININLYKSNWFFNLNKK